MNNDKWKSEGPDHELPFVIFFLRRVRRAYL